MAHAQVRDAFAVAPDLDKIVATLLQSGVDGLRGLKPRAGVPPQPMLAKAATSAAEVLQKFKNMAFSAEFKYDGQRAQVS